MERAAELSRRISEAPHDVDMSEVSRTVGELQSGVSSASGDALTADEAISLSNRAASDYDRAMSSVRAQNTQLGSARASGYSAVESLRTLSATVNKASPGNPLSVVGSAQAENYASQIDGIYNDASLPAEDRADQIRAIASAANNANLLLTIEAAKQTVPSSWMSFGLRRVPLLSAGSKTAVPHWDFSGVAAFTQFSLPVILFLAQQYYDEKRADEQWARQLEMNAILHKYNLERDKLQGDMQMQMAGIQGQYQVAAAGAGVRNPSSLPSASSAPSLGSIRSS